MAKLDGLPCFLYRAYDATNELLYVGITGNVTLRIGQHAATKSWWHDVAKIDVDTFPDRASAMEEEAALIRTEQPRYNVMHSEVNPPRRPQVKREHTATVTYHVTAKRWELGWELHVDGVGVTQSRSLATAETMVREYVASMLDIENEHSFDVELTPELDNDLASEARAAREAVRQAERARDEAAVQSRKAVHDLKAAGLSGSDVAVVLKLSTQRVSQLINS